MIDINTKYNDYITFIKDEDAYCVGFEKLEKVYSWETKNPTMEVVMDDYSANESNWILNEHWANWSLHRFGKEFSAEIRKIFISKVRDDMSLYKLYTLTDTCDATDISSLRERFRDKLPNVEKYIEESK